jgi:hypothetical protein
MKKYWPMLAGIVLMAGFLASCGASAGSEVQLEQVVQGFFAAIPQAPPIPEDNPMTLEKIELGRM